MKNVLVFPCGSEIGLELQRCLSRSAHFRLWGAASVRDHGVFAYERYADPLPMINVPGFLAAFNRVVKKLAIDYVFPAHDEVIVALARWRAQNRLGCEVMAPELPVCELCRSKSATYRHFAGTLAVPHSFDPAGAAAADYPLFVKPDAGQGSRGAARVDDAAAAAEALRRVEKPLLLEYLPGDEYTVDCFTDRHGRLLFAGARERRRVSGGISVNCRSADDPVFTDIAECINARLALRGPWFFQLRNNAAGSPVLLEIAPRIAGSSGFQRARGVNLPLLALYDRMNLEVEVVANALPDLEMDRALANAYRTGLRCEAVYVDYDETLVLDGRVNADLVKFIFQCLNQGIPVRLLTRHIGDLDVELRERRLAGLFDAIILAAIDHPKSAYIAEKNAIFIDDSFAERSEVSRSLGIPVYDPAAIEVLIDSRF